MPTRKGNILVLILTAVALLSLTAASYLFWQNQTLQNNQTYTATNTNTITKTPPTQDETANWKTYTNTKYGYSLKYPEKWYSREFYGQDSVRLDDRPLQDDQMGEGPFYSEYIAVAIQVVTPIDVKVSDPVGTRTTQGYGKDIYIEKTKDLTIGGKAAAQMTIFNNVNNIYSSNSWYEVQVTPSKVLKISLDSQDQNKLKVFDQILSTFKFN